MTLVGYVLVRAFRIQAMPANRLLFSEAQWIRIRIRIVTQCTAAACSPLPPVLGPTRQAPP
jgi:hypothetical protein